ncbi:hypothetical protein ACFE04_019762 [Oxalis oulophora]
MFYRFVGDCTGSSRDVVRQEDDEVEEVWLEAYCHRNNSRIEFEEPSRIAFGGFLLRMINILPSPEETWRKPSRDLCSIVLSAEPCDREVSGSRLATTTT